MKTTDCNITGVLLAHTAGILYRVHEKPCNPFLEKWFKKNIKNRKSQCYMKCWKILPPSGMHAFTPFVVDTCFYYQSKHNTLNTMHASATTYFSHHQVKLHRHLYTEVEASPSQSFLRLMRPNKEFLQSCLTYSWIFSSNSSNLCRFLCRYPLSKTPKTEFWRC